MKGDVQHKETCQFRNFRKKFQEFMRLLCKTFSKISLSIKKIHPVTAQCRSSSSEQNNFSENQSLTQKVFWLENA